MKKILLVSLLILSLVLCLCACGEGEPAVTNDTTATTEAPTEATDPTKPTDPTDAPTEAFDGYTITVVDEAGNPVAGAIVQMCLEACVPGFTDDNGVATFDLPEDDYKVSFVKIPEGYALAGEEENFYFEDGSKEMTITLKAAA